MRKNGNSVITSLPGTLWVPTLGQGEVGIEKPGHLSLLERMVGVEKEAAQTSGVNGQSQVLYAEAR